MIGMKKTMNPGSTLWFCLLLACLGVKQPLSAQSLVANGGFESYAACPVGFSTGSDMAVTDWAVPTSAGSPDYFNVCGVLPQVRVPQNQFGNQPAHGGNGYVGLYNYGKSGYREYLQIELDAPLEAGCKYYAEMFVSLADSLKTCGTDRLGMYFSKDAPQNFEPFYAGILLETSGTPFVPQVQNPAGQMLSNATGWTKISGVFTATGGERFLTIGNFALNTETTVPGGCSGEWQAPFTTPEQPVSYYYLDDVGVSKVCIAVSGNATACPGEAVTLAATGDPVGSYRWFDVEAPSLTLGNTATLEVTPAVPTTYAVAGQYDTAFFTINLLTAASLDLGEDTLLCQAASLVLDATFPGASFLWENGSTDPVRTVTEAGTYSVTVSVGNCEATDDIVVEYGEAAAVSISLGEDLMLCLGDSFELKPQFAGAGDFTWSDDGVGESATIAAPGTVWVRLENECFSAADTVVAMFRQCCEVFVPTAFSPNGDGINDEFMPHAGCELRDFRFAVFSRWGDQLFESTEAFSGWDGKSRGILLAPGDYAWLMEYQPPGEKRRVLLKGGVTLVW